MLVEPKEAIASLKLLACMAKADGKLHPEEKKILTEAWQKAQQLSTLPEDVTIDSLFAEDVAIEEILPQINTPKMQKIIYKVAYILTEIDGIVPAERIILDKIESSFQSLDRDSLVENDSLAELAVKAPHDFIEAIAIVGSIFGGFGAFFAALMSWATITGIGFYVPVIGEFAATSFLFTLTWAIGQATNQFYLSGRQLNSAALKQAFLQAQKEGKILSKNINFNDGNFKSRSPS